MLTSDKQMLPIWLFHSTFALEILQQTKELVVIQFIIQPNFEFKDFLEKCG